MPYLKEQAKQQPRDLSKHLNTKTKSKKVVSCLCCWTLLPKLVSQHCQAQSQTQITGSTPCW